MICRKCIKAKHHKCKGGTWCDCQHRVKSRTLQEIMEEYLASLPDFSINVDMAKGSFWPISQDEK